MKWMIFRLLDKREQEYTITIDCKYRLLSSLLVSIAFQLSVSLQKALPLQYLEPRFRILLRCDAIEIVPETKPQLLQPNLYVLT